MSLRLRLTLLTGMLTGSIVLLSALVFYLVLQASLLNEIDTNLQGRAALVAHALAAPGDPLHGTDLAPVAPLEEFDTPGIYVELLAPSGDVQASSPNLVSGRLPADPQLIAAAQAGRTETRTITAGGDEQLRLMATPAQPDGVLIVAESLEPLQRTLTQARTLLAAGGLLAFVLAFGGAALLTGRALAPVNRLTRAASLIAATGNYHQRVPSPSHNDEVGQLATTINELIATVERTLRQQRQFLADTSHELRSPLTTVLANLNLLRRNLDQQERDLSVGEATAEAQRMRRLVNDLLLLAQADAAQVIAQAPVRLDMLIAETVATLKRQAAQHILQIQIEAAVTVIGDQERLTQLLRNLLENAAQHTAPGTTVTAWLRSSDGMARLTVADTGPGIAAEHLPHIWDRFYRVDKARSRVLGGTGLGLAIVKYIAEAHGGSVSVVSELGQGTTFTILLPLAAVDQPAEQFAPLTAVWSRRS
jgi:two-component system OmpR family sensor kinase